MTEIYGIYAILLLISTITSLYLAFYSWNKRKKHELSYFSFNFHSSISPFTGLFIGLLTIKII